MNLNLQVPEFSTGWSYWALLFGHQHLKYQANILISEYRLQDIHQYYISVIFRQGIHLQSIHGINPFFVVEKLIIFHDALTISTKIFTFNFYSIHLA